ncbi:DEAD/DEAH box helicase [Thermococcus sp. GR7]|uniref:DEAD/DEAH box helicase n=1 Tax=unclassified Thermococcus TaxID=2627626 RepID=UPI001431469F|nr:MULTISPECIES: DEAD/DEAH box helicase [unclassified Thermococcus]NJE47626.1 DEAD/DEAH box helicase [Thermococcus sp. GR7]NJE78698.1 DEAD/DEAH box helicase [Thermococcus sp. GR4]NJF22418.1 DEAD/DEAH box helicase [Thermococcus sp. GR5]
MLFVIRPGRKKNELEAFFIENEPEKLSAMRNLKADRIYRFIMRDDRLFKVLEGSQYRNPKEIEKALRQARIVLVNAEEWEDYFKRRLQNKRVEKAELCRLCLLEGKITVLTEGNRIKYHNEYICERCAEDELKRELRFRFKSVAMFDQAKKLLERFKDLDKVLYAFDPRFDPTRHPEVTKWDELKAKHVRVERLKVDELNLPEKFKSILKSEGVSELLPVQSLAIKRGLLEGESLLVVSATASGKTLIGELAGVPKAMEGRKMLFLVPLVALANQKYEDFKRRYSKLGLRVAIRVGMSRIKTKDELVVVDTGIDADIIVGTYEGIDYLLRAGRKIGNVGTIVIDEIHMLDDEERGPRLDGLIARLRKLYPNAQFIGLSATIGNPEELAKELGLKLVLYDERPVDLERHIIIVRNESEKWRHIANLCRAEASRKSRQGYKGQSIVFTFSRKRTHELAAYLTSKGLKAKPYHSGLPYRQRKLTEMEFQAQTLDVVVTTAALGAGVDFPASQVIFESLAMGNKWLRVREFHQMLGRAGRPLYHEKGKVYLIVEPGRKYSAQMESSEDEIAFKLLTAPIEPVVVEWSDELEQDNVLAHACVFNRLDVIEDVQSKCLGANQSAEKVLEKLEEYGFIRLKGSLVDVTPYGRAVSMSFLLPKEATFIRGNLGKKPAQWMAVKLLPFENLYLSGTLQRELEGAVRGRLSANVFSPSFASILEELDKVIPELSPNAAERLFTIYQEFFMCPEDDCTEYAMERVSNLIIELRRNGKHPTQIAEHFRKVYGLVVYPGDVFTWLDGIVRKLEAIERIARVFRVKSTENEAKLLRREIEEGGALDRRSQTGTRERGYRQ